MARVHRYSKSKLSRMPELAPLSEPQRDWVVRLASQSWRGTLLRCLMLFVVLMLLIMLASGGFAGVQALAELLGLGESTQFLLATAAYLVLLIFGFYLLNRFRYRLLRSRVRHLLRTRGLCPKCSYSLLGTPIGADRSIVCPECGHHIEFDLAADAEHTDSHGKLVYNPSLPAETKDVAERRKRRRRAFIKWTSITTGTLAAILLCTFLYFRAVILNQAERAAAKRNFTQKMNELVMSVQPKGGDQTNRWDEFERITHLVSQRSQENQKYTVDFGTAFTTISHDNYEIANNLAKGSFESERTLAISKINEYRTNGVQAEFTKLHTIQVASYWPSHDCDKTRLLQDTWQTARYCVARMALAIENNDFEEFTAATNQAFSLARIIEVQGIKLGYLTSLSIEAMIHSAINKAFDQLSRMHWDKEVLEVLTKQNNRLPKAYWLDCEHALCLDECRSVFSDSKTVASATLNLQWLTGDQASSQLYISPLTSLEDVEEQLDDSFKQMRKYLLTPRHIRGTAPLPPPTSACNLIDKLIGAVDMFVKPEERLQDERLLLQLKLALSAYKHAHGHYPETLSQVADNVHPDALTDQSTGKPMVYKVIRSNNADERYELGPAAVTELQNQKPAPQP